MKLALCAVVLLALQAYSLDIPPFPSGGAPQTSSSSGGIVFDPNAIRVVTCSSVAGMFSFASIEANTAAQSANTLTFQVHTGANAGITGAFASVNAQSLSAFTIVNAYESLEEVDASGKVVATHSLTFSADSGSAANCSAASATVYHIGITASAGTGSVNVGCTVVTKPTSVSGLQLSPNRMKCDVTISGYTYQNAANKIRLNGRVGYNSASVSANGALTSACAYSNGEQFCIQSTVGIAAYVSFDGNIKTGATLSGTSTVQMIVTSNQATSGWTGYTGINNGNSVQWLFNAAGESDIFWDPEIGIAQTGFATMLKPSLALLFAALLVCTSMLRRL